MEEQLLSYIERELKRGVAKPAIKKALLDVGWNLSSIEEAFARVRSKAVAPAPFACDNTANVANSANGQNRQRNLAIRENKTGKISLPKKSKPMLIAGAIFAVIVAGFALVVAYLDSQDSSWNEENVADIGNMNSDILNQEGDRQELAADVIRQEADLPNSGNETVAIIETNDEPQFGNEPALADNAGQTAVAENTGDETQNGGNDPAAARDERRKADMESLLSAQESWHAANGKYYTCGLYGGDCGGKPYGYPTQIGGEGETSQDPLYNGTSAVCGRDYVYCGLNNASYSHFFCYYAKLEGGGYYTASHAGNFMRSTAPKIFEECAVAD